MALVQKITLPGVGVRHEFTTQAGDIVGVLVHHDGRRDVLKYDRQDPDQCVSVIELSNADSQSLAEMLGAGQVTQTLQSVQQDVAGLAIEWIQLPRNSLAVERTIAAGQYRQQTGASIVAVLRSGVSIPAPQPDLVLEAGDTVVAVATHEGASALRSLLLATR